LKRVLDRIVYSPSDLVRFVQSPYVAWMERCRLEQPDLYQRDPEDPMLALLARKGDQHEDACLDAFRQRGIVPTIIDGEHAFENTRRALENRDPLIFQAALADEVFEGFADFLALRDPGIPDTPASYVVLDAKLARHVRPYFVVQLCCYADMLEHMTGQRPSQVGVLRGDGVEELLWLDDFRYYYRHVREEFLALMARFPAGPAPAPDPMGELGSWRSHAEAWVKKRDHLSQVANITRGQIRKLEAAGINTFTALAAADLNHVRGIEPLTCKRLQHQARLQAASVQKGEPVWELLPREAGRPPALESLPAPDPGDVFFDIEGYPLVEGGLEYLFGVVVHGEGGPRFLDWWAHDAVEEKRLLEEFVDWLVERRRAHPGMHVFHYGHYEITALKRLMCKYGTREDAVDELLRGGVFVDLYRIVTQSLRIGEPGYSLKNLERLWADSRAGDVATAGDSVVFYDAWTESGQPRDWRASELLKAIRDYNEEDCLSTQRLAEWLWDVRSKVEERPAETDDEPEPETEEPRAPAADVVRRLALAERLAELAMDDEASDEERHISQMLGWLVDFHRRADKPMWWAYFERMVCSEEELADDLDCLSGVRKGPITPDKKSYLLSCSFDPDQDTKLAQGKQAVILAGKGIRCSIESLDRHGLLQLKLSSGAVQKGGLDSPEDLPQRFSLIPYDFVNPAPIVQSVEDAAQAWLDSRTIRPALRDFLLKSPPRIVGHSGGPLVKDGENNIAAGTRIAKNLDSSVLCIQGPPGTGKTFTAAKIIHALLADGKKVGISSNSHKAILHLMGEVYEIDPEVGPMLKIGDSDVDPLLMKCPLIQWARGAQDADYQQGLVGGTAWWFSNECMMDKLDYLFVDEAGQVSVGNLVGMARAAKNLVLLGDQMQLGQPIQGSHPGESGASILEYYLAGRQTIPPDKGLFLDTSWRMHPRICGFISEAMYERRLSTEAHTANRRILATPGKGRITVDAGIVFVEACHTGNRQSSDEEVELILELVAELLGRTRLGKDGMPIAGGLTLEDFLFVAPFNMQVRKLERALGPDARVGSVDKFQGQQAPVVFVSLCSSDGDGSRGIDFVLDRNRLNVAVSRAESLAIVVGSPGLGLAVPNSLESMRRLNLFHQLVNFSTVVKGTTSNKN
jgi:predicted RecB family nuclease